jgi:hypothetical protein
MYSQFLYLKFLSSFIHIERWHFLQESFNIFQLFLSSFVSILDYFF